MKTKLLLGICAAVIATSAFADVIDDPLHGCTTSGCTDNGTITLLNSTSGWGFSASPAQSGTLDIFILVPDNDLSGFTIPQVSGTGLTGNVTPTVVNSGQFWTSGDLSTFVGLTPASPSNPISGYLSPTQVLDAGATGFEVFEVMAGAESLNGPSGNLADTYSLLANLPAGTTITAFLGKPDGSYVATAPSGQLEVQPHVGVPGPTAGTGIPGMIFAGGVLWAFYRHRQKFSAA